MNKGLTGPVMGQNDISTKQLVWTYTRFSNSPFVL